MVLGVFLGESTGSEIASTAQLPMRSAKRIVIKEAVP